MSNEQDKATARPWEIVHGDEGQIFIFSNGCEVAELYTDNADCIEDVEADAALIVRAVNSHDKLVAALDSLACAAARIVEDDDKPTMIHMRELDRRRQAAVEVLDAAK